MQKVLALLIFAAIPIGSFSQDIHVREEAVRLLEKANAVATPVTRPNLERVESFRVFSPDQGVKEGTFTRVVIRKTGRRDETTFGDYHQLDVVVNDKMSRVQSQALAPAEVETMMRLTPMYYVSFNGEDVIHTITNREVNGKPARCIEFDTIVGQKNQANEICVDAATGAFVLEKVNEERIEFADFFEFAGALLPGRINYSSPAAPSMEIKQSITALTETIPNVLVAPPNAEAWTQCKAFRRAFGQSMPQPKPGNGGTDVDVVVRGVISADGRVHDAVIQSSERPDLNVEALDLIHRWVFTPPTCDNQATISEASFNLHFHGR